MQLVKKKVSAVSLRKSTGSSVTFDFALKYYLESVGFSYLHSVALHSTEHPAPVHDHDAVSCMARKCFTMSLLPTDKYQLV